MIKIKLSSKTKIPNSVKEAQAAYKKASKNLLLRSYTDVLKARTQSMMKDFKIHKAAGVLFTFLGLRLISDYKKMRSSGIKDVEKLKHSGLRTKLDAIGYALSAEMARDPVLRKAVGAVAKEYPYLSVNKQGEIFVSSYSGSIMDASTVAGKIFNPDNLIPPQAEKYASKKVSGQKLNLNLLLKMGSPQFEAAKVNSGLKRSKLSPPANVTASIVGNDEIRLFSRKVVGAKVTSKEELIKAEDVRFKRLTVSKTPGKKIIWLGMKKGKKLVKIELDEKKADSIFNAFNLAA